MWDKAYREDVLAQVYRRCRRNRGNAGVDSEAFEKIEAYGVEQWLVELGDRLRGKVTGRSLFVVVGFPNEAGNFGTW